MLFKTLRIERRCARAATLLALSALLTTAAHAADFGYTLLHVDGGLATQASGITADGTIVGSYQQPQGQSVVIRPFSYRDGMYRKLPAVEPAVYSFDDVNDKRHLVANLTHRDRSSQALLIRGKQKTAIEVPGAVMTRVDALNNLDTVVGSYDHDPDQYGILTTSGFLWTEAGGVVPFDAPGAVGLTIPWGLNKAGTAVGVYIDADSVYHGFVRGAGGTVTTLDYPGSPYTQLMDINDSGDIVGFYQDPVDYIIRGFLYRAGKFIPVGPAEATQGAYPWRIAANGRIVGWYANDQGLVNSFLATPSTVGE
ncbi:hypothetical protein LRH25_17760 [Ideonella azotifigens]|nr:hypothetical protein [Ideonella azotifigens]MCD2342186.1 hypothetical protein [Ideonella azotifigens]